MWSGSALFSSGESGTPRMNGNVHKLPVVRATRHKEGHCASRCQCKPLQNHPEISFLTSEKRCLLYAHLAGSQRCENDFHLTRKAFFFDRAYRSRNFPKFFFSTVS